MKDLTHYFQFPPKEESKNQKENIELLIDNCDESPRRKQNEKLTKRKSTSDKSLSSSSAVVNVIEKKCTQSNSKSVTPERKYKKIIEDKSTSKDIDSSLKHTIHEPGAPVEKTSNRKTLLHNSNCRSSTDKKKVRLSLKKSRKSESSLEHISSERNEVERSANKKKVRLSLKKSRKSESSLEHTSSEQNEVERSANKKKVHLSLKKSRKSESSLEHISSEKNEVEPSANKKKVRLSSKKSKKSEGSIERISSEQNGVEIKSNRQDVPSVKITETCTSGDVSISDQSNLHSSLQNDNLPSHTLVENTKSEAVASKSQSSADQGDNLNSPPLLDDNRNAFYILMSSRTWKSPHEDANKSENESPNTENKIKNIDDATPSQCAEAKENARKRKRKLENMVEQKIAKKTKCLDSSAEKVTTNSKKTPRRILIIPESDSDDDNENSVPLKSKRCAKVVSEENDEIKCKESNESIITENKSTSLKVKKGITKEKLAGEIKPLQNDSQNTVNSEISEEIEEDESENEIPVASTQEKPARKKLLIDFNACYVKLDKITDGSAEKLTMSHKRKLIMESSESNSKMDVNKKSKEKRWKLKSKNSVFKASQKLDVENNEVNNKTPVQDSCNTSVARTSAFSDKESTHVKELNPDFTPKKNASFKESDSERSHLVTPERQKRSKIMHTNKNVISNEVLNNSQSLDNADGTKKRNSLFSYFNKVSKEEALSRPDIVCVTALIHSPPKSPSKQKRRTVSDLKAVRKCSRSQNDISGKEDDIVVEKSNEISSPAAGMKTPKEKIDWLRTPPSSSWRMRVILRESSVEPSDCDDGDASDDNIFTPKKRKKWPNSNISVQQEAAKKVLQKAKTRVTARRSQDNNSVDDLEEDEDPNEIIICSSSEKSKSDDTVKLAPLFVRKIPKPKLDPAIVEARKNFLKSGVPEPVKKFVDLQRSLEERCQFKFPSIAHIQQKDTNASVWNLPIVKLPVRYENEVPSISYSSEILQCVTLGMFTNCSDISNELPIIKPSAPEPIKYFRKLLQLMKLESPDFPIYRSFRRLRLRTNSIKDKHSKDVKKDTKQKKRVSGRKTRNRRSVKNNEETTENCNMNSHVMWTEKYKPQAVEDIVSNMYSVEQLKKWLESWKQCNDEMLRKDKGGGRKRKDSSSGDEFADSDSNDSSNGNLPNNTAILIGPHGCGKTAAVYAVANELGCKVLEINTSSKRKGKRILSELQEATQSHQVRAGGDNASVGPLNPFFKGNTTKPKKKKSKGLPEINKSKQEGDENSSRKMSIILVEGVDVVYEDHDEGFISALNTLVASSKRPVILITNVSHCSHLSRFMDTQLVLRFTAPLTKSMSVWLQLICLLEGVRVNHAEIEKMLDQNRGDTRKTLLQLQFWVLSGGNNIPINKEICISDHPENTSSRMLIEEHSNLSWASNEETDDTPLSLPEHSSCAEMFTEFVEPKTNDLQIPFPSDLSSVWWNLASFLSLPDSLYLHELESQAFSSDDMELKYTDEADSEEHADDCDVNVQQPENMGKQCDTNGHTEKMDINPEVEEERKVLSITSTKENEQNITINKADNLEREDSSISMLQIEKNSEVKEFSQTKLQNTKKNECCQKEADSFSRLLERMSDIDVVSSRTNINYTSAKEPCLRSWDLCSRDGTSLSETVDCNWWENLVFRDLCHYLLEKSINRCRLQLQEARACQEEVKPTKVTYVRPTQQELRWRLSQHAADISLLPGISLWCHSDHHSVSSDYLPMLRSVSRCEQGRLTSNTKRRNRFFHYLKGLNVHVNENVLRTLCAMFEWKAAS